MKKLLIPLVSLLSLAAHQACAVPITYSMTGNGFYDNPVGSFTYDQAANRYSNVSIWSLDYYHSATGSASTLRSTGVIGSVLRLTFSRPLSDAGGNISFSGYEQGLLTLFGRVVRSGEVTGGAGGGTAVGVPEPGALLLLGTALLGLALARRRFAARPL